MNYLHTLLCHDRTKSLWCQSMTFFFSMIQANHCQIPSSQHDLDKLCLFVAIVGRCDYLICTLFTFPSHSVATIECERITKVGDSTQWVTVLSLTNSEDILQRHRLDCGLIAQLWDCQKDNRLGSNFCAAAVEDANSRGGGGGGGGCEANCWWAMGLYGWVRLK